MNTRCRSGCVCSYVRGATANQPKYSFEPLNRGGKSRTRITCNKLKATFDMAKGATTNLIIRIPSRGMPSALSPFPGVRIQLCAHQRHQKDRAGGVARVPTNRTGLPVRRLVRPHVIDEPHPQVDLGPIWLLRRRNCRLGSTCSGRFPPANKHIVVKHHHQPCATLLSMISRHTRPSGPRQESCIAKYQVAAPACTWSKPSRASVRMLRALRCAFRSARRERSVEKASLREVCG